MVGTSSLRLPKLYYYNCWIC